MKKTTLIVILVLLGIYILACAVIYSLQRRIIFLPAHCSDPPPGGMNISEKYFMTGDGQQLHAWWMPVDSAAYTLVFFHGNAGCVSAGVERMKLFRELGFNTLMVDYRGYGKSSGEIGKEDDIYEDGRSTLRFANDSLGVADEQLIVWGWSLGGAVAVDVCRNRNLKAVVLEGTFFSMDDIAGKAYPIFPTRCLLKYHFRSGEKINGITAPLFFIHSEEDHTIPFEQGKKLFDVAPSPKSFLSVSGSHNKAYYEEKTKIINALKAFIGK